jgi:PAS domain S-box-containing protein
VAATALLIVALLTQLAAVVASVRLRGLFSSVRGWAGHLAGVTTVLVAGFLVMLSSLGGHLQDPEGLAAAALVLLLSISQLTGTMTWAVSVQAQRAQAAEALSLGEYYRGLFENSGSIVLVVDPLKREIVDANVTAARFYRYPQQHMRGMNVAEIDPTPATEATAESILAAKEGRLFRRARHRLASAQLRDVEVSSTSVELNGQGLEIAIVRDVTDRELAQRELDREHRLLESRIAERTRELADTVARLEATAASKDRFLANISHELRTPLNSIIGYTGVVLGGMTGDLNDEQRKQLGMVERSSRHLLSLVNDLLDVAQLEQGVIHVEASEFIVADVLNQVAELMDLPVREKGLSLQVLAPDERLTMSSDRMKVEQVLINLVDNAVKFTQQGSITLLAEQRPDGTIAMIVTDTGVGMPAHAVAAVTEAFEQLYGSDGMKPAGIGLGLSISKRLAQALGGTLRANSIEKVGSSFTFIVPRVYVAAAAADASVEA